MKASIKLLSLSALFICLATFASAAPETSGLKIGDEAKTVGLEHFENITLDEFLQLTPKKIKESTGQKLTIKQSIALKVAQKKVKKELKKGSMGGDDQLVALILVIMLGGLGIHRFYLGYIGIGIIQLLTLGGCGIWWLIDMIRIITGDLQPKNGVYEETL